MSAAETIALEGRGRLLPTPADAPARVTFGEASFTLAVGAASRVAAYRDVATVAVQHGSALLVLGSGPSAERWLLGQFGQAQGQLVRELRERRLRQQFADALMKPPTEPLELVEYRAGDEHGVSQIGYHPWGVVLAPVDERLDWIRVRRASIDAVTPDEARGELTIATRGRSARSGQVVLIGLGQRTRLHADRIAALRRAADEDAGRLIGALVPDAEYTVRQEAARRLIDGQPATPADLPTAWPDIEAGVLTEPTFASAYSALRARAGALSDARSIALAPIDPGSDDARSWFFVPLAGNLVALELVSEGAHATYFFRVQPRAEYAGGQTSTDALPDAVRDVSEALVDSRFLREPMALPDDQLRLAKYLRYRLALRVLPSLAAARRRFVARIVHRDEASWSAAIDDLITWHATAHDDAAVWPGRASQETMVGDAAVDDGEDVAAPAQAGEQPVTGGT